MSDEIRYNGRYLDLEGLQALWDKINNLFPRNENLSTILDNLDNPYIHKDVYDKDIKDIRTGMEEIQSSGVDIDNKTIVYGDEGLETNLILDIDGDCLRLVTKGDPSDEISSINLKEIIGEVAVKDGMLESASVVVIPGDEDETESKPAGTYIKFVFNTDAGKEPIYLNVSEFVNILAGDDYLTITNNKISINFARLEESISSSVTITGIQSKLDEHDTLLQELSITVRDYDTVINDLKTNFQALNNNVNSYEERIVTIENTMKTVPTERISDEDINDLK